MMTIDFMLAPLFDEQGSVKYLIPSALDITDRKKAEEEREQLIGKLEEAIKELEGFTYSVSHDLRAPIRHLASYAHLLQDAADPALDEKSRKYIKIIANASEKLGIQVDELLEFSRMGRTTLKRSRVDLDVLIRDMARIFTEENQDRYIEWNIHPLPVVAGDPTMLQLVFANLIGNGVKYTRNRPRAIIEIGSEDNENNHIIYVRDNGIGFDMKYYDKIFGIFQRLHISEEFEGTGIGLANVQRIIQRHGGRVWADSRIDKGATFYISLPKII
jgi:light-regulated signal transduction histidine kinase (bacteriophytochrome)